MVGLATTFVAAAMADAAAIDVVGAAGVAVVLVTAAGVIAVVAAFAGKTTVDLGVTTADRAYEVGTVFTVAAATALELDVALVTKAEDAEEGLAEETDD